MQKLYCYVDETGQETKGGLFLVCVVITKSERNHLIKALKQIEQESGKGKRKWNKAKDANRSAYIRRILQEPAFKAKLHYALYHGSTEYVRLTIEATAHAIAHFTNKPYKATVIIDGLGKSERRTFGAQLRKRGIQTAKVRGATEQANIFIRLADALCGFLRQAEKGREEFRRIMDKAIREGYLTRVGEE